MFYYQPTDGEICSKHIKWLPRTCFLMFQQGGKIPDILKDAHNSLVEILESRNFYTIDANSRTTGRDFLYKIWEIAASVPIGFAIIHEKINPKSMANIFYELGIMQALGKETLVIRVGKAKIPSDFIRTEYVNFDENFETSIHSYIDALEAQAKHYIEISEYLLNNPILSLDYLKRAFLITKNKSIITKQKAILESSNLPTLSAKGLKTLFPNFSEKD